MHDLARLIAIRRIATPLGNLLHESKGRVGLTLLVAVGLIAILAPFISPYDPNFVNDKAILAPPSGTYLLGTDFYGRDVLSRVFWGARLSMYIGLSAVLLNVILGVSIGLVAGYKGGRTDDVLMRVVDLLMAFPAFVLALAVIASLGPGVNNLILVIAVVYIPSMARITRGAVLAERNKQYVESAKSIGKSNLRIALTEILPNAMAPITIQATLNFSSAVLIEASLSFLGLGVQPPAVAWGTMLFEAQAYMANGPWAVFAPGIAIFLTVMGINLLGDALRDIFDPTLRR